MDQRITKAQLKIAKALLKHAETMDDWAKPSQIRRKLTLQGARRLSLKKANYVFVGVLFDQGKGMDTKRAWKMAKRVVESIGDKSSVFWESVASIKTRKLKYLNGSALHRYPNKMSRYLKKCATRMMDEYGGNPRKIWNGERCVSTVRDRLEEFMGIGPNLSRMAVRILVCDYGLLGGKQSLPKLDVKADVLLKRVFDRAGLVPPNASDDKYWKIARKLNPDFPAALDPPAWDIGNRFCTANDPNCYECPLERHCPRTGL